MQGPHLRKYGVSTTINFDLFEVDGVDFRIDAVHAAGDSQISKNEGAQANTQAAFLDEGDFYSLALTTTEMEAARIVIRLIDQTATKVWLDKSVSIETYGDVLAAHAFDLDLATQDINVASMDANTITSTAINANAITSAKIATDAIGSTQLAANAIGASEFAQGAADKVWSSTTRTITAFSTTLALSIWDVLETAIVTASSIGLKLKNNLDVVLSTRMAEASIDTTGGAVDNVTLVDTTTANTDMRGTDSAALASVATEARLSELDDVAGKLVNQMDIVQTDTSGDIPATLSAQDSTLSNIQNRLPTVLIGGTRMNSSVEAMAANVLTDTAINAAALTAAKFAAGAIDANALATDAVNEIRDAILPPINTAFDDIEFLMVDATDGFTPETGLTVSGTRSINGGSFVAVTGTIAEVANGIYQIDASAADMNGKTIMFRFTATGAADRFVEIITGG